LSTLNNLPKEKMAQKSQGQGKKQSIITAENIDIS
jgi:hypothetical protein